MRLMTNDLILRTVTESDLEEIARMWEYPHETTLENARRALEHMTASTEDARKTMRLPSV